MNNIYAVVNQKGGVGKTTTAVNLAAGLGLLGERVLLVDADPQGNATTGLGIDKSSLERCMYDALTGGASLKDVIVRTEEKNLWLAPATLNLAGADIELMGVMSREKRLGMALESVSGDYSCVIIDCPPSLGLLTVNVLTCAKYVILPIQCEYYAMEGITQLLQTITLVTKNLNPGLKICKILLTMFDYRTALGERIVEEVKGFFGDQVSAVIVPRNVKLAEAPSHGKSIFTFAPDSMGARNYGAFAVEVSDFGKQNHE